MTSIEDTQSFFNSYLDIDYAGNTAVYSESDETVNELREESMTFWHALPGVQLSPTFGRPMGMPVEQLAQLAATVELARRALFLVAEYSDPTWGKLYAAYIGGDRESTARSYGGLLYAAEINGNLKIIASYREDIDQLPPPVRWRHSQGAEIDPPKTAVSVHPLEAPTGRAAHRQDWEALRDAATR
ncbi:hypothetical protein OG345_01920 [Streptomyces sp. NBC_01220]|uniref:hypothetical protein n=1 Tax=unclassified Streptomyces TaxID=2593676 RepID=UPI002E30DB73|nr:hypothetical protein [Streptomyces sp. NBC_01358]WSQ41849.1 hypothetical protein OG345_01920 [Streptomyces sp. NBC_01220]